MRSIHEPTKRRLAGTIAIAAMMAISIVSLLPASAAPTSECDGTDCVGPGTYTGSTEFEHDEDVILEVTLDDSNGDGAGSGCLATVGVASPDGTGLITFDGDAPVDGTGFTGWDDYNLVTHNGVDFAPLSAGPFTTSFPDDTTGALTGTLTFFDDAGTELDSQAINAPIECDGDGGDDGAGTDCLATVQVVPSDGTDLITFDGAAPVNGTGFTGWGGYDLETHNGAGFATVNKGPFTTSFPDDTTGALTGTLKFFDDDGLELDSQAINTPIKCGGDGVEGIELEFFMNNASVGTAMTNETGVASLNLGPQEPGVYEVRADSQCGCLVAEATIIVKAEATTPAEPAPGCPAVDLQASANEDGSITVNVTTAATFVLVRSSGGDTVNLGTFEGDTQFMDTDNDGASTYTYTVLVDGDSCGSIEVTAIPFFPGAVGAALAVSLGVLAYIGMRRRR